LVGSGMVESDHTAVVPGRPETPVSIPDVQEQLDLLMSYAVPWSILIWPNFHLLL
jgi:hypothetical protein